MLVDNKFIFISLPRCASTSFHISCIRNNIDIKFAKSSENNQYYDLSLPNDVLIKKMVHIHERTHELNMVFGNEYDIISIKRDRYERFLSLWNFLIKKSKIYGNDVYYIVKNLHIGDILSFDISELDKKKRQNTIDFFLKKHNLIGKVDDYFKNLLFILWQPTSFWHNNDPKIIWFDFNKLDDLERWVSDKINKPFILEHSNSSKDINTNIILNDEFISIYNKMYDRFDLLKTNKTFI
jgi:hypothetical protein